jgi:hypothetical protein
MEYFHREGSRTRPAISLVLCFIAIAVFGRCMERYELPDWLLVVVSGTLGFWTIGSLHLLSRRRILECRMMPGWLMWSSRRLRGPSYRKLLALETIESLILEESGVESCPYNVFLAAGAQRTAMDMECVGDWKKFLGALAQALPKLKIQVRTLGPLSQWPVHEVVIRSLNRPVEYVRNVPRG